MSTLADPKLIADAEAEWLDRDARGPFVVPPRTMALFRRVIDEARRLARFADFAARVAFGEADHAGLDAPQALDAIRDALAGGGAPEGTPEPWTPLRPRGEFAGPGGWAFAGPLDPAHRGRRDLVAICGRCSIPTDLLAVREDRPPAVRSVAHHVLLQRQDFDAPDGPAPPLFVGRCGRCGQWWCA